MGKNCQVQGCEGEYHGRDYCRRHYDRQIRGIGLSDWQAKREENLALVQHSKKRCSGCGDVKALDDYLSKRGGIGDKRAKCRECFYVERKSGSLREARRHQDERRNIKRGSIPRPTKLTARDMALTERAIKSISNLKWVRLRTASNLWESDNKFLHNMSQVICAVYSSGPGRAVSPWHDPSLTKTEKYRLRYRIDTEFVISERIRRQVTKKARKLGVHDKLRSALVRGGESPSIMAHLGYTIAELRSHIERQFTKGMTWKRFMSGDIHIDHIMPVSSFNLASDEEVSACWAITNLMPLWAADNLAKSNRIEYLL